jgi:hypothetical protein
VFTREGVGDLTIGSAEEKRIRQALDAAEAYWVQTPVR